MSNGDGTQVQEPTTLAGDKPVPPSKPATKEDIASIMNVLSQTFNNLQANKDGGSSGGVVAPQRIPGVPQVTPSAAATPGQPLNFAPPPANVPIPTSGNPSIGDFGTKTAARNAGLVSLGQSITGLVNTVEQRHEERQSALAENYMMQINALLSSGDPNDRKKAEMFLEDPKILKTLKKGLEYQPLQEEVPPEAKGIKAAFDKIKQGGLAGDVKRTPQQRPVLPQPTTSAQIQQMMSSALLQRMQKDPGFAFQLAKTTLLSSSQQEAAEKYQAGLDISPAQRIQMDFQKTLTEDKAFTDVIVEAQKAQTEMEKQLLDNKGRIDERIAANAGEIAAARIRADATVEAAMKRRSLSSEEFTTHSQPKLDAMHRAQQEMNLITSGNTDPKIRSQLLMDLQQSGLESVAKSLPGGIVGFLGRHGLSGKATADWSAAKTNLDAAAKSFEDSLNRYKQGFGQPSQPGKPVSTGTVPQLPEGAVSIGTSKKDGKDHYLDAQGKDLGVVEQ